MGCPSPLNRDSEDLLSIGAGMLGQYENISKPVRVDRVSKPPSAWRVLTIFGPGTGEYEGGDLVDFELRGDALLIKTRNTTHVREVSAVGVNLCQANLGNLALCSSVRHVRMA